MTKIKSGVSLLLTLCLICMLCACGNGKSSSGSSDISASSSESSETEQVTTEAQTDKTDEMVSQMTLEEKVGQMFLVACPDVNAQEWVGKYHLGGYVLFGRDFADKTADEIKADIAGYQSKAKIPLLIGADEEGGTVVRVSDNPNLRDSAFLSPKDTYASGGWEAVESAETEKAELLLSLGVNVNLAPVCDVTGNIESFIYDRSFSGDPDEVSEFVKKTVTIYNSKKLGSVLKHFPGYGDNTDTHEDMSYDDKSYEEFKKNDFPPFSEGIKNGAGAIMVAHNITACMDPEMPASLSENVHKVIRDEFGFDGVIMTDDLAMQAITKYTGTDAAAVAAAKCGNDILCCSDVEAQYPAVIAAVQSGEIPEEQIDASVKRILKWKQKLGLLK